ncbi:glycoside hydrolase family 72 protein [Cercophora newfieldiana]|uniref:1,3-beta-glucanosyltransferase n=1 Tax=Cercophora newfieldiana TaxID=92897 RepID=A0AA40CLS1_9PEZI|nr:glycoside hydrolase family 72 protein [Cercophora newfieldiana]
MRSTGLVSVLATVAGLATASPTRTDPEPPTKRSSMPTVTVSGNAFWQGNTRFYIRGVDYQPGGSSDQKDPLADPKVCKRDIALFKALGINTIRVYITDNSADHDSCMDELADAGIYVIFDANNPKYSINRFNPESSYNHVYLQSVFATIDAFAKYPNTLAFFSGNEVVNDMVNSTLSARFVKATTRDMRQYIGNRGYRKIPVGYSAADVAQNRKQLSDYMNCGTDDERSDFFAFNDYSWCNSDFKTSGWDQKVKTFAGYGIPIFLSEYGCNTAGARNFGEIGALMSRDMTGVYSGGLMYEYAKGVNNYGIVDVNGGPDAEAVQEGEFSKFQSALSAYPPPEGDGGAQSKTHAAACPTKDDNWLVDSTLLPAIPEGAMAYMKNGAGPGPGLGGAGSQNAGGTSTGDAKPGSGSITATPSPSSTKNAASKPNARSVDKAPIALGALVIVLTLSGTLLL